MLMKWFLTLTILWDHYQRAYASYYDGAALSDYTLNKLLGRWYVFAGEPYGLGITITRTWRGTARVTWDSVGGQTYNDCYISLNVYADGLEDMALTGATEDYVKSGMYEIFTEEHDWNHYMAWEHPKTLWSTRESGAWVWSRYPPREEDHNGVRTWERLLALDAKKGSKKNKKKTTKKTKAKKKSTKKIRAKKPRKNRTRFTGVTGQIEAWLVNAWNQCDVWLAKAWNVLLGVSALSLLFLLIAVFLFVAWRLVLLVISLLARTVDVLDFLFELVGRGCRRLPIALRRARRFLSRNCKRSRKYLQAYWCSSKRRLRRVWEGLSGAWIRVWHPERFAKPGELEILRFDNRQSKQKLSTPSGEISQRGGSQVLEEQAHELKKARDLVKRLECDVVGHQVLLEAQTEKAEKLESELASAKEKLEKLGSEPTQQECSICAEGTKSHAFMPCGHRCVCEACARLGPTTWSKCPICQQTVDGCVRIYL